MDIRAALRLPKRKGEFKPSRSGLSAAQIISEMNRWYKGLPQNDDMMWQDKSYYASTIGWRIVGPWSCVDCHGEAVYEPTPNGNYFIHQCPLWKPSPPVSRERQQREDDEAFEQRLKFHDMNSGGFGGL